MYTLVQGTRLAFRTLGRQPLVAAVMVLTLALGLGANAAVWNMVDVLTLRPFQFRGVDQMVMISENLPMNPDPQETVAPATFLDFKRQADVFDRLAAFDWWEVNLVGADEPERVFGFAVSADFFPMLGVAPEYGRLLAQDDTEWGHQHRVVLSDGLWRRRFGGDPAVVGQAIHLDGESYEIVGVAPRGFDFPLGSEIWAPLAFSTTAATSRTSHSLTVLAHLRPGTSIDQARGLISGVYARLRAQYPKETRGREARIRTLTAGMIDSGLPTILGLWQTAALVVLLIACTNVANLLLARGVERQREVAVQLAIGASRWRVVRQLLAEGLVLAIVSVPVALFVAGLALASLKAAMPAALIRFVTGWNSLGIDGRLVAATVVGAVAAVALFGLLPAWQVSRPDLTGSLKEGGRSGTAGPSRGRLRRILVVAQIALALPLLVASGLAALGTTRFVNGPQGYDPTGVMSLHLVLPAATYPTAEAKRGFVDRLLTELSHAGGAETVATSSSLPATSQNQERELTIDGRAANPDVSIVENYRAVSPQYFDVLRIPLVKGRPFGDADRTGAQPVAIVSQSFAARYWPGADAIGRRVRIDPKATDWTTIVGICGNTIDDWFANRDAPTIYVPEAQAPSAFVYLVARTGADPASLAGPMRTAIAAVDKQVPATQVMSMRDRLRQRTAGLQFVGALMAVFGVLALVLASGGLYGVMAFYVSQRRREIGVRMALGATASNVVRLTVGHAWRLSIIGVGIGLGLAILTARAMESALFGIVAVEPDLFVAVVVVLLVAASLASWLPARRATRVDPALALRME